MPGVQSSGEEQTGSYEQNGGLAATGPACVSIALQRVETACCTGTLRYSLQSKHLHADCSCCRMVLLMMSQLLLKPAALLTNTKKLAFTLKHGAQAQHIWWGKGVVQ